MRPIDRYNAAEMLALAEKLEKQGLFAAIDIQDSDETVPGTNKSRLGKLNDVVADSVRYIAECKQQAEQLLEQLRNSGLVNETIKLNPNTAFNVGME